MFLVLILIYSVVFVWCFSYGSYPPFVVVLHSRLCGSEIWDMKLKADKWYGVCGPSHTSLFCVGLTHVAHEH